MRKLELEVIRDRLKVTEPAEDVRLNTKTTPKHYKPQRCTGQVGQDTPESMGTDHTPWKGPTASALMPLVGQVPTGGAEKHINFQRNGDQEGFSLSSQPGRLSGKEHTSC